MKQNISIPTQKGSGDRCCWKYRAMGSRDSGLSSLLGHGKCCKPNTVWFAEPCNMTNVSDSDT